MAHFAEIDDNGTVLRVVVVGDDIPVSGGGTLGDNDMHIDGEKWCISFFKGGTWKQTSYNNNFRKQYAGKGYVYDSSKDKFLLPQPYASWALDANDDWQAPVTYPTVTTYGSQDPLDRYFITWDEPNLRWTATDYSDPVNNFNWDASALAWVSA
tara:strand:- start:129 stop:590 length:462 start_codon:yes stop_codon:yes gene_type:complete